MEKYEFDQRPNVFDDDVDVLTLVPFPEILPVVKKQAVNKNDLM